ncbi:alanyl-tRNA editing protein Aarsd1 isoform X2 [Zootermopsis nevadensis]|uniref:alanyl-tRNA editing protein Aarsd1 isoform X2 n=1 Tax=Zootermopsis nevadensis TaxID=136037 RepID=UPI000B8E5191|nr:alanyl-tRNA editing protein Aarsd1 isoform X2 [Zootermopsis nevadensis]
MVYKCQEDSFLKEPCDYGLLGSVPVLQVTRRGADAVHFVESALPVGKLVTQKLDWERRLDHMQQHSGQHLITALADIHFGYPTTSWWLGEEESYIEFDTQSVKPSDLDTLEELVNEKIRAANPVIVTVYKEGDSELKRVRTRGLPDDHKGAVRVVTIEGVESNMCCGTHVTNLSQLQAIKILRIEKGKKNKTNLHFLVGGRVLRQLSACLHREYQLTALLKNGPADHVNLVDKLQRSLKYANKNLQAALRDIAAYEGARIKQQVPTPVYVSHHRKEADSDFMSILINEVGDQNVLLFLTVGDDKGGQMVLHGEPATVAQLGPQVCALLNGKGAAKGPKFQAKVSNFANRTKAEELISQYLAGTSNDC